MTKSFDVFLSHNSKDKPAVRELAEALRARGLKVWLDEWELVPGRSWQEALEAVIRTTQSSVVLVGRDGIGPWEAVEMRACLSQFVRRRLPVIPVLLPGAPGEPEMPFFLHDLTWVDLRGGLTEDGLDRIEWGISGTKPDRSSLPSIPPAAPETSVAAAKVQPAAPKARPARFQVTAPAAVTQEQLTTARTRWSVPAWIGLLALLGIAVFLFAHYFPKTDKPEVGDQETGTPGTGELTGSNAAPAPVPAETETKPAGTALKACTPGIEREEAGIVFVRICPGTFTMGSAENDPQAGDDEKPAHKVMLTSEFWIGRTEITNKQYRRFRQDHPGEAELPATGVGWAAAKAACEHFDGRLPTEAEWEYAARAGSQTAWSFGNDEKLLGDYAWYQENANHTPHPVATRKPNDWGLHDMHGNVWEWVADWYGTYSAPVQPDPTGPPAGERRVVRGGSFVIPARYLRSAVRDGDRLGDLSNSVGFRCVRVPRHQP